MNMGRAVLGVHLGEKRKQESENLIPIDEREASVDDSLHGVGEERQVLGLAVDARDNVNATRLQCNTNSLQKP